MRRFERPASDGSVDCLNNRHFSRHHRTLCLGVVTLTAEELEVCWVGARTVHMVDVSSWGPAFAAHPTVPKRNCVSNFGWKASSSLGIPPACDEGKLYSDGLADVGKKYAAVGLGLLEVSNPTRNLSAQVRAVGLSDSGCDNLACAVGAGVGLDPRGSRLPLGLLWKVFEPNDLRH